MQKRAIRLTLFALLLLTGIGASYVIWDIQQRLDILFDSGRDLEARLDRVTAAVAALGGAQQAYVAPGQIDDPWFSRVTSLVRELTDESAALGRHSHSPGASTKLRMFLDGLQALVRADSRARENLNLGQELMAADLIYSEARDALAGMSAVIGDLREAEAVARGAERNALITDAAKRSTAYKDITDYVLHNGPYVVLYQPTEPFGLRSNVKGFVWSPMDWTDFAAISK